MVSLDEYKSFLLDSDDIVLDLTLAEDDDGNIGFDLVGGSSGFGMLKAGKGIATAIETAKTNGVDFVVTCA
jgi:hypothetical protein